MNGQMKNYSPMYGPYKRSEIPDIAIDLRGLVSYAKSKGVSVPELSDSEKQQFVLNATMDDLKRVTIRV